MSATLEQARELVAKYGGQRVRIRFEASDSAGEQRDAHILEGRLGRLLIPWRGKSESWSFTIFGRCSDWPRYAERFRGDPVAYAEALRSCARPDKHYCPFRFADRIEPAPDQTQQMRRRRFSFGNVQASVPKPTLDPRFLRKVIQLTHPDKHSGSALATEVTAALNVLAKRGAP